VMFDSADDPKATTMHTTHWLPIRFGRLRFDIVRLDSLEW
jgi:hypothetical protein